MPAGDAHPGRGQLAGQVQRRTIAFQGGVGRHDNLPHAAGPDALQELVNRQLLGANAVQGRQPAVQDVVESAVRRGSLQGEQVARLLDHAQHRGVAPRSAQRTHRSPSVRLQHWRQGRISSLTARRASARASTSSAWRRANGASGSAVLGPMPGSLPARIRAAMAPIGSASTATFPPRAAPYSGQRSLLGSPGRPGRPTPGGRPRPDAILAVSSAICSRTLAIASSAAAR